MPGPLTAAQRRVLLDADPASGLLGGSERTRQLLASRGLAVRHARPPHRSYLTPAGQRLREELLAGRNASAAEPTGTPAGRSAAAAADSQPAAGVFRARTGQEEAAPNDVSGAPDRARNVRSAWEGLLELRRVTGGDPERPAAWERSHPVAAAALALEAARCTPGATNDAGRVIDGYRVTASGQPDAVCVSWVTGRGNAPGRSAGDGLRGCAAALRRAGWQVTEHPSHRPAEPGFLLASPRRV